MSGWVRVDDSIVCLCASPLLHHCSMCALIGFFDMYESVHWCTHTRSAGDTSSTAAVGRIGRSVGDVVDAVCTAGRTDAVVAVAIEITLEIGAQGAETQRRVDAGPIDEPGGRRLAVCNQGNASDTEKIKAMNVLK